MIRIAVLIISISMASCLFAENEAENCKNPAKSSECKKTSENYEARAKEAEKDGNKPLAEAYKKCAEAKQKMSEAYSSGNQEALKNATAEFVKKDKILKSLKKSKNVKDFNKDGCNKDSKKI